MASCVNSMFCFSRCRLFGSGGQFGHTQMKDLPKVQLDTSHMGGDVVIVKNGRRICGTGGAVANAPLVQNKSYFEIKVQSTGIWGVGLANKHCDLNKVPLGMDADSWVLQHSGVLMHNNEEKSKLPEAPQEGDVVGMTFDHMEFNFYINGQLQNCPFTGIRGTVFPVMYVDDGAILDVQFNGFYHQPPPGFEEIMIEQSLL